MEETFKKIDELIKKSMNEGIPKEGAFLHQIESISTGDISYLLDTKGRYIDIDIVVAKKTIQIWAAPDKLVKELEEVVRCTEIILDNQK